MLLLTDFVTDMASRRTKVHFQDVQSLSMIFTNSYDAPIHSPDHPRAIANPGGARRQVMALVGRSKRYVSRAFDSACAGDCGPALLTPKRQSSVASLQFWFNTSAR